MLINLENQWKRWYDMYCTGNFKTSYIGTQYTSSGVNADNDNRPRQLCNKFGGWNAEGMAQFNIYSTIIKRMRKKRTTLEQEWRASWNLDSQMTISKKRKRSVVRAEAIETAKNDLFPSDDENEDDANDAATRLSATIADRLAAMENSAGHVTPNQPSKFAQL